MIYLLFGITALFIQYILSQRRKGEKRSFRDFFLGNSLSQEIKILVFSLLLKVVEKTLDLVNRSLTNTEEQELDLDDPINQRRGAIIAGGLENNFMDQDENSESTSNTVNTESSLSENENENNVFEKVEENCPGTIKEVEKIMIMVSKALIFSHIFLRYII